MCQVQRDQWNKSQNTRYLALFYLFLAINERNEMLIYNIFAFKSLFIMLSQSKKRFGFDKQNGRHCS
jgi:hypothetical protein